MTPRRIAAPPLAEIAVGVPVLLNLEPLGFDVGGTGLLARATFVDQTGQRDGVWMYRTGSDTWESSVNLIVSAGLEGRSVDIFEATAAGGSSAAELFVRYRETDGDRLFPVDRIAVIRTGQLVDADLLLSVLGETANGPIDRVLSTSDGRFLALQTLANNLVSGGEQDSNDCSDIYLIDRLKGGVTRVSIANGLEVRADVQLDDMRLGSDGVLSIAFTTHDASLSIQDRNELDDVFVWRLPAATSASPGLPSLTLVSAAAGQSQGGAGALLSVRGTFFASDSAAYSAQDTNGVSDVWLAASGVPPVAAWPQALAVGGGMVAIDVDAAGNKLLLSGRSTALGLGAVTIDQLSLVDLRTGVLSALTQSADGSAADDAVIAGVMSPNGGQVAFSSAANNLGAPDGDPSGVSMYVYGPILNASVRSVVTHWKSDKPVPDTRIDVRDPLALSVVTSGSTDSAGVATLGGLGEQPYRLSAARSVSPTDRDGAISAADVLAALKMAHGRNPNADPDGLSGASVAPAPSAFQFVAADVDTDGRITPNDASKIVQMILANTHAALPDWRVFNQSAPLEPLSRSSVRWPQEGSTIDTALVSEARWAAVLPGDIDGNWHASADYLLGAQWTQTGIA